MPLGTDFSSAQEVQSGTAYRQQSMARALENDPKLLAGMLSSSSACHLGQSILSGIDCIEKRSDRQVFGPYEGIFYSKAVRQALRKRFGDEHLWSPSQLESYATCPFRFFVEHVLSLQPLDAIELRSDVRRRGSLLHHTLAALHQRLADESIDVEPLDDFAQELVQRFQRALGEVVSASPLGGLQEALREIERREIEAWSSRYAQQEIEYRNRWKHLDEPPQPAHFELRFGSPSRSPDNAPDTEASTTLPFSLDLGGEQILLTGQIDRVDIGRVGNVTVFNIIDYKTGKKAKVDICKIESGQQLQLPLYALAAESLLLAEDQAKPLESGYWSIPGNGFGSGRSGPLEIHHFEGETLEISKEWQQLQPVMLQRIRQLIASIRDGQFPVYNEEERCTKSCPHRSTCRVTHIRNLEKEWVPPPVPE